MGGLNVKFEISISSSVRMTSKHIITTGAGVDHLTKTVFDNEVKHHSVYVYFHVDK